MKNTSLFTMIGKHFGFTRNTKHHVFFAAGGLFVLGVEILPAEIVFSGDKNIAIPSNFDGVYINVVNGLTGSEKVKMSFPEFILRLYETKSGDVVSGV